MVCAIKGALVAEQFIEHDAHSPDIAAFVRSLPADLLRRHVAQRSDNHVGLGMRCIHEAGNSEVDHLYVAVLRDHDVGGFDVAVYDSALVGEVERAANRDHVTDLLRDSQNRAALDDFLETLSLKKLHRDERRVALLPQLVDRYDVRVLECPAERASR